VRNRLILKVWLLVFLVLILAPSALAASLSPSPIPGNQDPALLAVSLTFLLPIGLILLGVAAFSREQAVSATTGGMVAWSLAALAYFVAGFAFQFGGIAVFHNIPGLEGLYWEYSLLDTTWGTGWGMIGLKGFFMLNEASTPGALTLFVSQLPLLGTAALILYFALQGRTPRGVIVLASLLMGSLLYPLVGNWTWASGWLANLGRNLAQGHGFVDAGGSGQVALVGASAALAALLTSRFRRAKAIPKDADGPKDETATATEPGEIAMPPPPQNWGTGGNTSAMPPVHLPILAALGAILMLMGWRATAYMVHLPTAVNVPVPPAVANLVLSAMGGALAAGLYSWFTTSELNSLMSARGLAAGLVVAAAGAPFIPPWSALIAGLVTGLLVPLAIFLSDEVLRLRDTAGVLSTFGIPALLGLLLPAFVADARYAAGWNGVGADRYLGVAGQGVSGLLVAPGFSSDWPGQLSAQLVGAAAILIWSGGFSWLLLQALFGLRRAWERSGLEFGAGPQPAVLDKEVAFTRDEALESARDHDSSLDEGREIREPGAGTLANAPRP
jgi:Amt family ammonium transporter